MKTWVLTSLGTALATCAYLVFTQEKNIGSSVRVYAALAFIGIGTVLALYVCHTTKGDQGTKKGSGNKE